MAKYKAVKHFNVYLRVPEFTVRTDHASLQYIKTLTDITDQIFRWILFLEQCSYKIEVRAGKDHTNADTHYRLPCNGKICICDRVTDFEKLTKTKVSSIHSLRYNIVYSFKFMPK